MTESEAKTILETEIVHHPECSIFSEALSISIQALEEVQQYRQIGTVDECRETMEKLKRLIDVADLEKFISEHRCVIGDDNLLLVAGNDGRWQEALPLVKTAYDVDSVIEQLKERSKEYNSGVRLHGKPEEILTDDVIEIVKAGGKNE